MYILILHILKKYQYRYKLEGFIYRHFFEISINVNVHEIKINVKKEFEYNFANYA